MAFGIYHGVKMYFVTKIKGVLEKSKKVIYCHIDIHKTHLLCALCMQRNFCIFLFHFRQLNLFLCNIFDISNGRFTRIRRRFSFAAIPTTRMTIGTFVSFFFLICEHTNLRKSQFHVILKQFLTIVFSLVVAQLLPRMEEQIRHEMAQDLFNTSLLPFLHACLSFDVVHEQICGVVQYCTISIGKYEMRTDNGLR